MRSKVWVVVLLAAAVVALAAVTAAQALLSATPVVKRKGWQYLPAATVGETYVAYTNAPRHGGPYVLYVRPNGGSRVAVNRKGFAYDGGFDGNTLIYQLAFFRRGVSDIHLYDAATQVKSLPAGVNTRAWEFSPTMSGNRILFGRQSPRHEKVILRDENLSTSRVVAHMRFRNHVALQPGQVNGDWATWGHYSFVTKLGNVFRYQISTQTTQRIARPANRAQYASSIAPNGALFYVRSRRGCGRHVVIRESVPGEADVALHRLPRGYDVYKTYVVDEGAGEFSVYFDQSSCSSNRSDIYKVTVP
jgi:hypothetical protein